jgi:hypothetical protein
LDFFGFTWVKADPAADLAASEDFESRKTFDAALAAFGEVYSCLLIVSPPSSLLGFYL